MNITIYKAESLPGEFSDCPEYPYQLPPGFMFLVDDDNLEVIEPALLYLVDRFIKSGEGGGYHTHRAVAYDLCDWWNFLSQIQCPWNAVDSDVVVEYRDIRLKTISPQTHEMLLSSTVKRRMIYISDFYDWAHRIGLVSRVDFEREEKRISIPIDSDEFAHTRSGTIKKAVSRLMPSKGKKRRRAASFLSVDEWRTLSRELGPLPTESKQMDDPRPSRDRLACELSINSGLRVDEIAKLTKYQILDLVAKIPFDAEPDQFISLHVTETKRLVPRDVDIPVYLIYELIHYIDNERSAALEIARKTWLKKRVNEPVTLFLNGVDARHHAGKPINSDTLDAAFRSAQFAAGLVKTIEKKDPDTREVYFTKDALHVFHTLRHTFAMWLYDAEIHAGNTAPWKVVQSKLGHAKLSTTMNTYLSHFDGRRRSVNRATFDGIRNKYNGN
ncbi:site-specific integrase [Telluria mixta]|uniref:Site-specific integrase n=1 Tax=Telluria mixta TaxID=34071 RepID=A0ABT2BS45_9BURK|nr:site-specific integrase [Telluria mixta]MCS0627943.1 site-specific integrase [Telluria mixta]WEM93938.1 site-specific integrase [Telluria mixta]